MEGRGTTGEYEQESAAERTFTDSLFEKPETWRIFDIADGRDRPREQSNRRDNRMSEAVHKAESDS